MPYSEKMRDWYLRRAGNGKIEEAKCEYPIYTEQQGFQKCGSRVNLQVHHLIPESVMIDRGLNPDDAPGLVICRKHHVGY